jgi:chromosome segregation ATPase
MGFIKKSTTILLVLLLTLSTIIVLLSMAYYRLSLGKINTQMELRDDRIENLSNELDATKLTLAEKAALLDVQIKREANLSSLFTDLKSVKEKTEGEKKQAEGKLNQTQGELLSVKIELDNLQYRYINLNSSYSSLNSSYAVILDDAQDICRKSASLNISECKKYD